MRRYVGLMALLGILCIVGCGKDSYTADHVGPKSISGVDEIRVEVKTGKDGLTAEQRNVKNRLENDNKPGAIKHLYIFSALDGSCLIYSTVREKVTSSGKRLSPTSVAAGVQNGNQYASVIHYGVPVKIGGSDYRTSEVLQDDGTYGNSIDYLFWFDSRGIYHQHYLSGGQIVHVSDQPMPVKKVIVNFEAAEK